MLFIFNRYFVLKINSQFKVNLIMQVKMLWRSMGLFRSRSPKRLHIKVNLLHLIRMLNNTFFVYEKLNASYSFTSLISFTKLERKVNF